MCGRFTLHHSTEEVAQRFEVAHIEFTNNQRFNIAPSQIVAAVVQREARELVGLKWGLVPFWAKDPSIGNRMINAKAETLAEKPSFKKPFRKQRCLIPADGFYEWQKRGKGPSQPIYFRRQDRGLFAFAGLWEEWNRPGEEPLRTCTIITVEPNELVSQYHHRMAAILRPEDEALWLDPTISHTEELVQLLKPYPDDELEAYPVSRAVNAPSFDDPACIRPI